MHIVLVTVVKHQVLTVGVDVVQVVAGVLRRKRVDG